MADTIKRGKPFTLQVEHDGVDTTSYNLLRDGTGVASADASAEGVQFPFPEGIAEVGLYQFAVEAVGPDGSMASDPISVDVQPLVPSKPVLKFLVTIEAVE